MAFIFAAGRCAPALADWEYTHWGMTPEQVAAASSGNVKVLPKAKRQADGDHSEIAAMGKFMSGEHTLSVGFEFDTNTGGLTCVLYNGMEDDVAVIKDMLVKKYGQTKEKSFGGGYSMIWKTPDAIELGVGEHPLAGAVTHCKAAA